ncbi:UNVERIFIED_CONTAM: hypothetical protein GTU68_047666, partial [Idotea baltica]|nr:hypothetical protein [Idotea baltica]
MGIPTVGIFAEDDSLSLHTRKTTISHPLEGVGVPAYLDQTQLIQIAKKHQCTLVHPGYGFLSENEGFAQKCKDNNLTFIGPQPEVLSLLGDKIAARNLAIECEVPIIPGTLQAATLSEAYAFMESLESGNGLMIKALAGGGGRGMRAVHSTEELAEAWKLCQSEAEKAFGNAELYVEQLLLNTRHIEIQILGDGSGAVSHLGERECSIQRRNQKLIEIAPCPFLNPKLRVQLIHSAVKMARKVNFASVGTFEFL